VLPDAVIRAAVGDVVGLDWVSGQRADFAVREAGAERSVRLDAPIGAAARLAMQNSNVIAMC